MPYARFLATALLVLLTACGKPASAPLPATPRPKAAPPANVVLIVLDTLRADRVEAVRGGVPVMPHLAALAKESLYFPRAVSPCSWTKPAMASVLTSLHADVHGVHVGVRQKIPGMPGNEDVTAATSDVLPEAVQTMGEYFQARDYDTFCFQTNGNLNVQSGFQQGFPDDRYLFYGGVRAEKITQAAENMLPKMRAPYFMYVHYMDPHTQYLAHPGYTDRFVPAGGLTAPDKSVLANFQSYFWDQVSEANGRPRANKTPHLSDAGKAEVERLYDGECRYMDEYLHRFIEAAKARDPFTVFVITADHGEEFWEHNGLGHGLTLYDDQTTVPLIIHGPGIGPERRETRASTLGILPAIAATLNMEANPAWQGENLIAAKVPGPAFSLTHGSQSRQRYHIASVVDGGRKFIDDYSRGFAALYDAGFPEKDQVNQLEGAPGLAHVYRRMLSSWAEESRARRAALLPGAEVSSAESQTETAPQTVELSQEEQDAMAALGYLGGDETATAAGPQPNIALIVIDTLRSDRIHASRGGVAVMPNLSALARGAWDFRHAIAQASWTKPSMTSLMTGMFTDTHGVNFGVQAELVPGQDRRIQVVPQAAPMAAEYFRDLGYTTIGFQTNQHLQCQYGFGRGFGPTDCAAYTNLKWAPANAVTDAAVDGLKTAEGPFLLYAHYFDPHGPYTPPAPYSTMFPGFPGFTQADEELRAEFGQESGYYLDNLRVALGVQAERETGRFSAQGQESIRYLYDAECRVVDTEVQRLINFIDARYDNTIIVITADHGEEFWEHGSIGHGKTVYDEVVRVPLIIRLPGEAPRVIDTPVASIDILPTLAARLGTAPLDTWQGRDLAAAAEDDEAVYSLTRGSVPEFRLHLESIRVGTDKLIQNLHHCAGRPPFELYDLAADPGEQTNLADTNPALLEALSKRLEAHRTETTAASYPEAWAGLDAQTEDELKALGYLNDRPVTVPCVAEETP